MNWIAPMEPVTSSRVKEAESFIHEIKYDGIRGLLYFEGSGFRIFTKKGNERTGFYPELKVLNALVDDRQLVLDGEIYVDGKNGKPAFHDVLVRETVRTERNLQYYVRNYPAKYVVFDILQMNGRLLTGLPLFERKELLDQIMEPVIDQSENIFKSQVFSNGTELFEDMRERNMEGIVSKKLDSRYVGGKKHEEWFKTKFVKKMLCIVGGIQWKEQKPNSLLVGFKPEDRDRLVFMGKASLGLKESDLLLLKQFKHQLLQRDCPFEEEGITGLERNLQITWISPVLTCWISFLELSNDGHFRHPKILGFTGLPAGEATGKVLTV